MYQEELHLGHLLHPESIIIGFSPVSFEADSVKSQRHGGPGSQSSCVPNAYDYLCMAEFCRKGLLKE